MKGGKNEISSLYMVFREVKSFIYEKNIQSDWVPLKLVKKLIYFSAIQNNGAGECTIRGTSTPMFEVESSRGSTSCGNPLKLAHSLLAAELLCWQCMTMYDNVWLCMNKCDYVCLWMAIWLFMAMFDYACLCMAMYGYLLLYMALYDYVWLCMALYDYVWLCVALYDYV